MLFSWLRSGAHANLVVLGSLQSWRISNPEASLLTWGQSERRAIVESTISGGNVFLKKITGIKSVGRFKAARIGGGNYDRFALIYGGNGRGKTTLCAILRSLQLNEPKHITRRKTFQATVEPDVGLLLDTGPVRFTGGAWSATDPDIHIFDAQFVAENVHGGDQIDVEHRRNFYRIVVGPAGVALAEEVDRLDSDATAKQAEIATEKKVLEQHLPAGMKLEAFLKLVADPDVDTKIEEAKRSLKAVNAADAIKTRKLLSLPALPILPEGYLDILAKDVDGIATDAARRVQSQIASHGFHDGGEAWLADGLEHATSDRCPFCANSLAGNELMEAYRGYFSQAYDDHKRALSEMRTALNKALSATAALKSEQAFTNTAADATFWKDYCDHQYQSPAAASRIVSEIEALFEAAKGLLNEKIAAPLEVVSTSSAFIIASANWSATTVELEAASATLEDANQLIQGVKDANDATDKATVEATISSLEKVQKRHTAPVPTLASGYAKLVADKKTLVDAKDAKKKALDIYDEQILGAYESDINKILATFGAGFRLAECGKNYVGKVPQSTYCLRFDTNDVDVSKSNPEDPGFDTAMSAGDKNTFALAFFLAQLKRDADLARKLVVFDDPFTSLDDFRRAMTAKEIVRTGSLSAQTIVLSHDKFFLDAVRELIHGHSCTTMQISGTAAGSSIEPWNIEWEVKEGYLQDHMRLQDFAEGRSGDARDMRTVMRPLLEKYIRYRFPNQVLDGKWLGDMLAIIRTEVTHPLTPQYQELDDINGYTAPFHHDPNTPFVDDEVRTYAQRTIAIVGGC